MTILRYTARQGESSDPRVYVPAINEILQLLSVEPLNPRFEDFGGFASNISLQFRDLPVGTIRFFGNFLNYSHVFCVDTNDVLIMGQLFDAIRANMQRADYKAARAEIRQRTNNRRLRRLSA